MELSIILCSRNRAPTLATTLKRYRALKSSHSWELIVVDNGSTDRTPTVIEKFQIDSNLPLRHITEPEPGLSCARNTGLQAASGTILAFTDDDCYPQPDYVNTLLSVYRASDADLVGGKILPHEPQDAKATVLERDTPQVLPPYTFPKGGFVFGANLSCTAELAHQLDGFDELLGAGTPLHSAEDIEFVARALERGAVARYDPRPTVYHAHGRRSDKELRDLGRGYDIGRGAYYGKVLLTMPTLRAECTRQWWIDARYKSPGRTLRQFKGALTYCLLRIRTMVKRDVRTP